MLLDRDKPDNSDNPPTLPLIFPKSQYHNQQSNKSLYKTNSESSHHTINPQNLQLNYEKSLKQNLHVKHSFVSNDLQNSASIKKYLKKGDQFNKFNAQRIFKAENPLEANALKNYLHKMPQDYSFNHLALESQFQEKSNQKSLKKIYISVNKGKKSNSSRLDKISNRTSKRFSTLSKTSQPSQLKKMVNQEVQTEKVKIAVKQKIIKPEQKRPTKHSPRINTLETLQKSKGESMKKEKSNLNMSKFINLSSILQKDEEELQPPKKLNSIRQNHLHTKHLINQSFTGQQSTAPSAYTTTYLSSMSKLSSNLNLEIEKVKKNRYDISQSDEKISPEKYSRTIQVMENVSKNMDNEQNSPINKEIELSLQHSSKVINVENFSKSSQGKRKQSQDISIQVQQKQSLKKSRLKSKQSQSQTEENRVMSLSVVPEQSETMNSVNSQSAFEPFSALSIVNQEKQDHLNQETQIQMNKISKNSERKGPKINFNQKLQKMDQMMQFPQITQLRISPMQNYNQNNQNRIIHPIRNDFNEKGAGWITDFYHPKSKILNLINQNNFIIKKYRNGVYFGELQDEKKHGNGIIFYFNGKLYEGKFLNDLKYGEGYEEFPDGSKYQGQFKQGVKCGKGIFEWSNGEVYEGEWFNGKKHGSGIWKSAEGQSYIGEWKKGIAQGFGVYISKLGDRYEGEFQNSQKQGFGTERYHNGETYVGQYRKNRPNGQGQYFWTNGNYYKGEFINHLRHGEGYFKNVVTGEQYRGQYRNDKKCGFGEMRIGNTNYVGNFENDYKHGYGQFYEDEECKLKGYWINGKFLDEDEQHEENCHQNQKNQKLIHPISQKPQLTNQNSNVRINRLRTTLPQKTDQGKSSLAKSRSPYNKSIESLQNSLQKSNYKRSCGCARKH